MELPLKITGVFLIFTLLISCVVATENKDLPTKKEITDFIAGIPVSDDYINTVFDTVIDKQPTWNCDKWVAKKNGNQILSLYYVDPDSAKGYGSIYFNELGEEISMRGVEVKLVEKHLGKIVSEENTPVKTITGSTEEQSVEKNQTAEAAQTAETDQSADENAQSVEDERLSEYEERLSEYEEKLDKYEEEAKKVNYEGQSDKYEFPTSGNEFQSVDDMAKTVDEAANAVKDVAKTVETVSTKVEKEEETKWHKKIRDDFLVAVIGGVVVCYIAYMLGLNRSRK